MTCFGKVIGQLSRLLALWGSLQLYSANDILHWNYGCFSDICFVHTRVSHKRRVKNATTEGKQDMSEIQSSNQHNIALNLQWTPSYMLYIVIIAIGMAIFSMEGSRHLSVYFFKSDPIWIQSYSDKLLPSSQVCDSGNSQLTVLLFCYFQHKGLCNYATSILNKWLWKLAMYLVLLIELGKCMQVSDILYSLYVSCQNNYANFLQFLLC